jgi:hypothetical protein
MIGPLIEASKKDERRIHWADNSGRPLEAVSNLGTTDTAKKTESVRPSRWSERTKMDIQHEKELLLQSRQVSQHSMFLSHSTD